MLPLKPDMKLGPKEVQKIAELARLSIAESEREAYAKQLSAILDFVARLNELETNDVEPTAYTLGQATPMREDIVVQSTARDVVLEHAPEREDTFFKVPKII